MKPIQRSLMLLPVLVCFVMPSAGMGVLQAPSLQEVNQALQSQDYVLVEKLCREIVDEDTSNAQAWFLLGYSLHAQGELDQAVFTHLKATTFPQTAPLAYYNLGCAHALKGNTDQAFKALDKAVELGISNPQQYKGDTDLKSLQKDSRWESLMGSMGPKLTAKSKAKASTAVVSDSPQTALHFWVGEWDVYSAKSGQLVGHNTLAFRVKKRVIHENWKSLGDGSTGESWNYFDPGSGAWKQNWLGSGGDLTEFSQYSSSDVDGVMLVGKSYRPGASGEPPISRMHVREIGDGRVQQTGTGSTDGGETWTVRYDLIYVPRGEKFDLEDLSI